MSEFIVKKKHFVFHSTLARLSELAIIGLKEQLGTCFESKKYHHSRKSSCSFEVEKMENPREV
jgi:hypothetical protein